MSVTVDLCTVHTLIFRRVLFITVHRTDCLTIEDVLNEVTVDDFCELKLNGFDIKQIDDIMEQIT